MTSYLASWLWSGGAVAPASSTAKTQPASTDGQASELDVPTLQTISPQASDDEGSDTEREDNEEDDDVAPAFPALNSAQRASTSTGNSRPAPSNSNSSSLSILTDSQRMPPPPLPNLASRTPGVPHARSAGAGSLSLAPPPAPGGGSLAVPLTTTKAPVNLKKPKRQKVALAPGHGALDWANLKSSGADLRGVDTLLRVTPSMLKQHNKKDDCWSAFFGKVYNITAYLPYHPGGEKDLMRVAGRDGTKLFATTHAWVSAEYMLDACLVGFLVPEPSSP